VNWATETADPILKNDLTLHELPKAFPPRTLKELAALVTPAIDNPEPMRTVARMERELPNCMKLRVEIALPIRANDLIDTEDPKVTNCSTEQALASLATERSESDDPRWTCPRVDTEAPTRA
jgi:hypothetical protein